MDFEAYGPDKASPLAEESDIALACWQVWRNGKLVKLAHTFGGLYEQQDLLDDIASVEFIVCAFAKYELGWLKRCGVELRNVLAYDVVLAQWVLDGNKKLERNLEALAKKYHVEGKIDIVSQLIKAGVDVRDINPKWLVEYCYQDVEATRLVFLAQQKELSARRVWHLCHVRFLTCSVLADIEFNGLTLDPVRVREEYRKATEVVDRLGAELAELTGGINLGSPKQLAAFLYDVLQFEEAADWKGKPIRTPKGERSAKADILAKLIARTDEQKQFMLLYKEYNKQVSLLEKNLDYFKRTCDERDGKFLGQFNQNIVASHRLSSSGRPILFNGLKKTKQVQLQNLPREFKNLFWSGDEDWLILDADGSQLEFRVGVDLSHDKIGSQEIVEGVDIHGFTRDELTKHGDEDLLVLPFEKRRQKSKEKTFRPMYGGSSGSDAVKAYCVFWKNKYKDMYDMQRSWCLKCVDKGQFTTQYGMTFYFDSKMQRSGYITHTTEIFNLPIQGFATGEIIPIALVFFWHRTKDLMLQIINTIHDSLVSRVHKEHEQQARDIAKQCLTYDVYTFLENVYHYKFSIPLGLECKSARNWGDGSGIKIDVWSDGREIIR